jgi:hypothetical protein
MILDMGNDRDTPLILGCPFLNTANACIYVASRRIQFHFVGKKETFAFTPEKPIFDEKQVRKKQPKKKGSKKPKPTEETEEPGKNKPKPRRTWCKKKESSSTSSSPDPANISEENKKNSRTRKKNPCARRSSREPHWKVHFYCIFIAFSIGCICIFPFPNFASHV